MSHFVFCHGFGFDIKFWNNLNKYFVYEKCTFIDLGYFKKPYLPKQLNNEKIIGIGHSIGLVKLINLYNNFECLIGLNSFVNFLGNNVELKNKRHIELMALKKQFLKNPTKALNAFYRRCGISNTIDSETELNLDLILSDLKLLHNHIDLPKVPTLIIASDNDTIVPKSVIDDNFVLQSNVKIQMIQNCHHAVGFLKPLHVYKIIMSFLDDKIYR